MMKNNNWKKGKSEKAKKKLHNRVNLYFNNIFLGWTCDIICDGVEWKKLRDEEAKQSKSITQSNDNHLWGMNLGYN